MKNVIITFLRKHHVIQNFLSLSAGEFFSRFISLITFAYLARTFTPAGFGIIGFAAAFVSYFILFVDLGFETYGAREISKNTDGQSKLVNSIVTTKIILSLFVFTILSISAFILLKNALVQSAIIIAGLNLFVTALSTDWYFQGIQKMQYIAFRQVSTSILNITLVFIFINDSTDVLFAIFISAFAAIINSTLLLVKYNISFAKFHFEFDFGYIKKIIKDSAPIALSSIMIAVYYNLDVVMLGFMKSDREVGLYSASVKIFLIGNVLYATILKSFFPLLAHSQKNHCVSINSTFRKYFFTMMFTGIAAAAFLYFFAGHIITIIYGIDYIKSVEILKMYSMISLIVCINIIFANPLLAWGRQKEYLLAVTAGGLSNIVLNFLLIPSYSYNGACLATLLAEVSVFITSIFIYTSLNKNVL